MQTGQWQGAPGPAEAKHSRRGGVSRCSTAEASTGVQSVADIGREVLLPTGAGTWKERSPLELGIGGAKVSVGYLAGRW